MAYSAGDQEDGESGKMKRIVRNYVRERLQRKGLQIPGYENEDLSNITRIANTLRRVGDELEQADSHFFDQMCLSLNITPTSAPSLFEGIADEIFVSGTNWGRIVAFLTFGSTFAAHCASREDMGPEYVDQVVNWTHSYMFTRLGDWMNQNGGWVSQKCKILQFNTEINYLKGLAIGNLI